MAQTLTTHVHRDTLCYSLLHKPTCRSTTMGWQLLPYFGVNNYLESDAKNIACLLYRIAAFIK